MPIRSFCLLLGLAVLVGCGGSRSKPVGRLTVTGSPTGATKGPVRVVLAFSKPMVASTGVDRPVAAPPVQLQPDFRGQARWSDPQTLVIVPTESLPPSTRFVVTIPGGTRALDGSTLDQALRFDFASERLAGRLEVLGPTTRATLDQSVLLVFNQDVAGEQLTRHCAYQAKDQRRAVKLAPGGEAGAGKRFTLQPAGSLTPDSDWAFACAAELRGTVGNLGPKARLEAKFRTYGPLRFVGLTPEGRDIVPDEHLRLALAFTNPLKAPYALSIAPAVPGFPERCHELGDGPAGLDCAVQLEPQTAYTITIRSAQQDVFGQALGTNATVSLRTVDAKPTISLESGYFVAELSRPVVPVWTRNVRELQVRLVEVRPTNFHLLRPLLDWWESTPAALGATKLEAHSVSLPVAGTKNQWGQRPLDPAQLLGRKAGPGMYYLELASAEVDEEPFKEKGCAKLLANFTDIGVVSKISPARGLVWATRLSTGKPLPQATVTVRNGRGELTWSGTTDATGVAVLPGTDRLVGKRPARAAAAQPEEAEGEEEGEGGFAAGNDLRIYVQHAADWTMVAPRRSGGLSPWAFNVEVDSEPGARRLRGFMHTDRGLYRPGERVHVKGLARTSALGEPLAVPAEGEPIKVEVTGPRGQTFVETTVKLSPFGGFWFDFELPGDARLGDYEIRARFAAGTFTREFSVEEYRPATFEVTGKTLQRRVVRRGTVQARLTAAYFYGAPLGSGEATVALFSRPRRVAFPAYEGVEFLDERRYEAGYGGESQHSQRFVTEERVAIGAQGQGAVSLAVGPNEVGTDADLLLRASVTAPSNEVVTKTLTVPYFRWRKYLGLKRPSYFLDVGKPQRFELLGVTAEGKAFDGRAEVAVVRRDWNCAWEDWGYRGSYHCNEQRTTVLARSVALSAAQPAAIEFTPASQGDYWVVAEGPQGQDEIAPAALQAYAWGGGPAAWKSSDAPTFDIIADRKAYRVGDSAKLILKTDLAQATGLVTIERDGVIEQRLIEVTPTQKQLTVAISPAYAPNVYVSVALVQGRMGQGARGKPRMRMGLINLPVQPEGHELKVSVTTDRKDYRPGAQVTATAKVTDHAGNPVAAEVSITAADEGVLSLTGFETPNPLPVFYAPWGLAVTSATQLEYLRDIPGPNRERPATGGDGAGTLRSRFLATALWSPGVVTDAAGLATVSFAAPDNLTAFRVMAVAADKGQRFGAGDQRFTVSKPLQLHRALPRFLALGDQLQGGVIVHNDSGQAGRATLRLKASAQLTATGGLRRSVWLAKGARVPVLFALKGVAVGAAALEFAVTMNGEHDALALTLPVQHPSPVVVQHLAHGTTDQVTTIPLALPAHALPQSAELAIAVDRDGLSGIEQGLHELIHYPYGCLEQTTSQVIPMVAIRELVDALGLEGLRGDQLAAFVKAGLARIGRHQETYGGFSLWPGGEPEPYYTAYALWGLKLAQQAGYPVDDTRLADGLHYLRRQGREAPAQHDGHDNLEDQLGAQAFALYVRALLGEKDPQAATTLLGEPKLPVYGKAFLARALAAATHARDPAVVKLVAELAALAQAATKGDRLLAETGDRRGAMSSPLRSTAIVLAALVELAPRNAAIEPLVRLVMRHRRGLSQWDTQQNLYALLALSAYARARRGPVPAVSVVLGGKRVLAGRLAGKHRLRVATLPLPPGGVLRIEPRGEVSYNVELRFRERPEAIEPKSQGIVLSRVYLDESGQPQTRFTVGDRVVVRLTTKLQEDGAHLIVSEPLPAGFEALNTRLATVGSVGVAESQDWGSYREIHDERVDFAREWQRAGLLTYELTLRAIAVGSFARPPTVAARMYDPAIQARTGLDRIEVMAKPCRGAGACR